MIDVRRKFIVTIDIPKRIRIIVTEESRTANMETVIMTAETRPRVIYIVEIRPIPAIIIIEFVKNFFSSPDYGVLFIKMGSKILEIICSHVYFRFEPPKPDEFDILDLRILNEKVVDGVLDFKKHFIATAPGGKSCDHWTTSTKNGQNPDSIVIATSAGAA